LTTGIEAKMTLKMINSDHHKYTWESIAPKKSTRVDLGVASRCGVDSSELN